ncbi:MAG: RNA 3'-phosphate cyclase, partial [Proteobacteria bacterium]|nr:RNA 3'-phosphate cyclase [Pseudomonadota bacterium]
LDRWGWYPRGGGKCTLRITPCQGLKALHLPYRGRLRNLTLMLGLSGLPLHIIDREEAHIRTRLEEAGYAIERRFEPVVSPGQGNVLFLKGEYEDGVAGFSALGKKGKPAEKVADDLCRQFFDFENSNGSVDKHLADQLLLYMALAEGDSIFVTEKVTSHLMTNIEIIEKFLPVHFTVDRVVHSIAVTGTAYTVQTKESQQ